MDNYFFLHGKDTSSVKLIYICLSRQVLEETKRTVKNFRYKFKFENVVWGGTVLAGVLLFAEKFFNDNK